MNYGSEGLSASDVALLTGNTGNNGMSGFGDGAGWWIIIFLIFALGGFGNRGGFGGGQGSVADNYILGTDFSILERKLDSVNAGICDSTFALNNSINNGFFGVQNTLCQGFSGVNQAITTQGYETRNSIFDLSRQFADCCCQTQRAIDGVNYNTQAGFNAIQNAMCMNTRDLIENANMNYRALHDELVANKLEMKNERIAEQQNEINALRLAASQERQNNFLIDKLGQKCPEPAYVVQPPSNVTFPTNCCGQFTGFNSCGCASL